MADKKSHKLSGLGMLSQLYQYSGNITSQLVCAEHAQLAIPVDSQYTRGLSSLGKAKWRQTRQTITPLGDGCLSRCGVIFYIARMDPTRCPGCSDKSELWGAPHKYEITPQVPLIEYGHPTTTLPAEHRHRCRHRHRRRRAWLLKLSYLGSWAN